jgi:glucose-6-phosphate dehydrogenase assembly protein OpcA
MKPHGMMARLSRLEDRVRPKGRRPIVVWWPDTPKPKAPEGADLIRVTYDGNEIRNREAA